MNKICTLLAFTVSFFLQLSSQNLELKWSSQFKFKNSKDGFFENYVGSSENVVYATFRNYISNKATSKKKVKKLKLIAFDKKTMKKTGEFVIKNSSDKSRSSKIKGLNFEKIIVLNDHIVIFWSQYSSKQYEIFAETINLDLGKKDKLRKVYTFKNVVSKESFFTTSSLVFLGSKELGNDVLIGSEIDNGEDKNVSFEYSIIGSDMKEVVKGNVELPVKKNSPRQTFFSALYCNYELGVDGNLFIKSNLILNPKQKASFKPEIRKAFSILKVVDIANNSTETNELQFEGVNILNFTLMNEGGEVRIYGFFSDFEKDPEGLRTHGIFFSTIKNGEMSEPKYTYFDQETINSQLYYQIELIKVIDKDHVALFCSQIENYILISSSSSSYKEEPYCLKNNVIVFNLTTKGSIEWTAKINRSNSYKGWDIDDLKVVSDENTFFVIYGNSLNEKSYSVKDVKFKKPELKGFIDYAAIDKKNGAFNAKVKMLNSTSTVKKERKSIRVPSIEVYDNQLFVSSSNTRINPYVLTTGCAASLFFPPLIAIPFVVPAFREGNGYLGTIKMTK